MSEEKVSGFELLKMAGELVATLEESEGVLDEASEEWLAKWFDATEDKIGAYWAVIQRLKAEADFLKSQADRMTRRRRAMDNASKRIRALAVDLMKANEELTGETKIKRGEFSVSLTRRKSTVITDEAAVLALPEYRREVVSVDKVAVGADLKAGKTIEGATLEITEGVTWR